MRLEGIYVGKPRQATYNNQSILTGIYKDPVEGPVSVSRLNIEGDQQADLTVHGGVDKAVYIYPREHYDFWTKERSDLAFAPGMFGENLSTYGLDEEVCVGDTFKVGGVTLSVTSPRMPCYKLGIKMGDPGFIRDFMKAEKNGFYLKVLEEGIIEAGNAIEQLASDEHGLTIAEVIQLYTTRKQDKELLQKAIQSPSLPRDWTEYFEKRFNVLD